MTTEAYLNTLNRHDTPKLNLNQTERIAAGFDGDATIEQEEAALLLARYFFSQRGNHSEMHVDEIWLAGMMLAAYRLGQADERGKK